MVQQRYHIHVCLVKNEQPDFENALQLATANSYFLTWDLQGSPPQKIHYSRQQIDRCDYVLFVLGNEYGDLSPSGVGYLHLSYVYAMTKRKPLFAVVKHPFTTEINQRQRTEFAQLIQKENPLAFREYQHIANAIKQIIAGLGTLIQSTPRLPWSKPTDDTFSPNTPVSTPKFGLSRPSLPLSQPYSVTAINHAEPLPLTAVTPNTPIPFVSKPATTSAASPVKTSPLSLQDTVLVGYSTHAYQEGNLSELKLTHTMQWREILAILAELPAPFSTHAIARKFNEYLANIALLEAKKVMPEAHAVSRCQIDIADFNLIRKQLASNLFLVKASEGGGTRELWQINPKITF